MTGQDRLEGRPDVLWHRIAPLWSRAEEGLPLADGQAKALAEGLFRIAVHPGTAPATALRYLLRAHRQDGTNPKHPYHVGLFYLRYGRPEAAVRWLAAAAALAPSNHRIWAHLSLAYSELDEREKGVSGYGGEHRARAEAIAGTIRAGRDDFDQELARPVPPLLRPGECRWSGVRDMAADTRLRGATIERTRDMLSAELDGIAGLADRREGGAAAVAVLAVQWLVYGYPVATVRRVANLLPPGDSPARRLLLLVCDLFEADLAGLPARLAGCLAEGALPDLLIGLIHQQRLLWRPLRFPDLGAHAAAREFTGGDPSRHEKALEAALRALGASPPAPMPDVPQADGPGAEDTVGPDERLAAFEDVSAELTALAEASKAHAASLAKDPLDSEAGVARVLADHEILTGLLDRLKALGQAWLLLLQRFTGVEPSGLVMEFAAYQQRVRDCEKCLQDLPESLAGLRNILQKKVGRKLQKAKEAFPATTPVPSGDALALAERMARLEDAHPAGNPPSEPAPATPTAAPGAAAGPPEAPSPAQAPLPADASERERVAHTLGAVERQLDDNFAASWRTMDAYPARFRQRPAVALLRAYLAGHQAETLLRLGHATAAARRWNSMLADEPMNPAVLRNLAVAHTGMGDPGQAAQAWSRYLEALYLRDLLHGGVGRGGAVRAELHRVLAGSFGTAALTVTSTPDGEPSEDLRQVPPVLASAGKVAIAVAHLRLEELNRVLSYRSPVLLLGVDRSVGDDELAAARDARDALAETAARALPDRVRAPFVKLCHQLINDACQEASRPGGRTRRADDESQEEAHLAWARERYLWKRRIFSSLVDEKADWHVTGYSGDVIANLRLIDGLPLDPDDGILMMAVRQLSQEDPLLVVKRLNDLSDLACNVALGRILEAAEQATANPAATRFPDQFRAAVRSWERSGVPDAYIRYLDDPQQLYYPSARPAFGILEATGAPASRREREIVTTAVTALARWVSRLPGATGPARALAELLASLGRHDEARVVLAQARDEAFSERGRQELAGSFAHLEIACGRFAEAVGQLRELLGADPDDLRLRNLLTEAYQAWITSRERIPPASQIYGDFTRWQDPQTVHNCRMLALNATLARHPANGTGGANSLAEDLWQLYIIDRGNTQARYHLAVALFNQAQELRQQIRQSAGGKRKTLGEELTATNTACQHHALELLALEEPPGSDRGTLAEEQRGTLRQILRALDPDRH